MTLQGLSATHASTDVPLREIQNLLRRGGLRNRLLAGYWAVVHLPAASGLVTASATLKAVEVQRRLIFSKIPYDYPIELWKPLARRLLHLIVTVLTAPVSLLYPELTIKAGTALGVFVERQSILYRIQVMLDDFTDFVIPFVTHPRTKVTTGLVGVFTAPFGVYKTFREVRDLLGFGKRKQIWDDTFLQVWDNILLDTVKLVALFAIPVVTVVAWKKWHAAKKTSGVGGNSASGAGSSSNSGKRGFSLKNPLTDQPISLLEIPSPVTSRFGKHSSKSKRKVEDLTNSWHASSTPNLLDDDQNLN